MLQNIYLEYLFKYSPLVFSKEGKVKVVSVFLVEVQLCRLPLFTVIPTVSKAMRVRERERKRECTKLLVGGGGREKRIERE